MNSLFTPLKMEGLTTLKINYDYKTDKVRFFCAKEWDSDLDFSNYNKDFCMESILTDDARYLNTAETLALYEKYNLSKYLEEVLDLIRQGKHFGIECYYNDKYNIRFMCNIHSRKMGINNKYHATMAGGIRRHGFEEAEIDVIVDGLNLGRGMSFKNIAAELEFGGCKTTVHMEPLTQEKMNNLDLMGFLAFTIDRSRSLTAADMNFPTEMSDVIREHFSVQYTCGSGAPIGESGRPTAHGVYLAVKEAVKFKTGSESLKGMSVAVQGLGAVGWYAAEHFLSEDVTLYVSDFNEQLIEDLKTKYPKANIIAATDDIMVVAADIFCPCAVGGIIHEGNIPSLNFKYIFGAANNVLKATSQEEEIRLARLLAEKGILYQTEWWHNTAGVLCGVEHYLYGDEATYDNFVNKVIKNVSGKTLKNLNEASRLGITPTENAYKMCQEAIYEK